MDQRRCRRGLTIVELMVVLAILVCLAAILMPAIGASRRTASCKQSNTQIRGIHQSLIMYAQSNQGFFPGLDRQGEVVDMTVENRFQILLEGNFFTGEYAISPVERKVEWTTGAVTSENYSFAMLDADSGGRRAAEWRETLNEFAPVLSARNTGRNATTHVSSIHGDVDDGKWRGEVAWNDNHMEFRTTHLLETRYGKSVDAEGNAYAGDDSDNLFLSPGVDDALMIYSGS